MKIYYSLALVATLSMTVGCEKENPRRCLTAISKASGERVQIGCITIQQFTCAQELAHAAANPDSYQAVLKSSVCSNGHGGVIDTWSQYSEHRLEDCGCGD